jgi:hypothetical protein
MLPGLLLLVTIARLPAAGELDPPRWYAMVREASAMKRAAARWAEDDTGALDELRFHWGSAYDIDAADGIYTATRRDGRGGSLADPSPGGLLRQIRADYAALPVSRSRS